MTLPNPSLNSVLSALCSSWKVSAAHYCCGAPRL